jgi:quercetin dioxygenase-like cupin family protein
VSVATHSPPALNSVELIAFALDLAAQPARWRGHAAREGTERAYQTIWSDELVNAWVICWPPDADTGFHDHDVSSAGIVVVEGVLLEERLTLGGAPLARRYNAGASFHLPACAIHRVRHGGGTPALTVHAYSPPLRRQGVYSVAADGALERAAAPYTDELRAERGALRGLGQATAKEMTR